MNKTPLTHLELEDSARHIILVIAKLLHVENTEITRKQILSMNNIHLVAAFLLEEYNHGYDDAIIAINAFKNQ